MAFQTIGFIGLGLIGGSIAKKMKSNQPDIKIYATAHHKETIEEAYREGLIENNDLLPLSAFSDCDYIFLCAPVQRNLAYLRQLKDIIRSDCYITDVGSTKTEIHEEVIRLGMEANFIGGHPMTGSEKTGILSATNTLLENAYYIITPTALTPKEEISEFRDFVLSLGAIPLILDYKIHDYSTAAISHLPHLVASSLVNLVHDNDSKDEIMKRLAAGGFKDITRIASSSPVMWEQICMTNTENILVLLKRYITSLESICDTLENHNGDAIYKMFEESGKYRSTFPNRGQGPIERDYSFCVDVLDEPGSISVLSAILAAKGISVKNIGINHSREEGEGALRISFYKEDKRNEAAELLRSHNYVLTK